MKYFQRLLSHPTTYVAALVAAIGFLTPSIQEWLKVPSHANSIMGLLVTAAIAAYHAMPPGSGGAPTTNISSGGQSLKAILLLACMLCFAVPSHAQTTPAPKTSADPFEGAWNISISGNFSNISQAANNNGFQTIEAFRIAQHWNLRADQFVTLNPSTTIVVAGPEYRFNLEHLLSKSTFAANASKIEAFVNLKAGTARSSAVSADGSSQLSAARFAYGAGVGFDILVNSTLSLRPLDISEIRASMLRNGGSLLGNHLQFATGLGLRF